MLHEDHSFQVLSSQSTLGPAAPGRCETNRNEAICVAFRCGVTALRCSLEFFVFVISFLRKSWKSWSVRLCQSLLLTLDFVDFFKSIWTITVASVSYKISQFEDIWTFRKKNFYGFPFVKMHSGPAVSHSATSCKAPWPQPVSETNKKGLLPKKKHRKKKEKHRTSSFFSKKTMFSFLWNWSSPRPPPTTSSTRPSTREMSSKTETTAIQALNERRSKWFLDSKTLWFRPAFFFSLIFFECEANKIYKIHHFSSSALFNLMSSRSQKRPAPCP